MIERMHAWEGLLLITNSTTELQIFLNSVIVSIYAIKFALEWKTLKKKEKADFQICTFKALNSEQDTCTKAVFAQKFKTFKSHHEKVITAQNEISSLFTKVCQLCIKKHFTNRFSSMLQCYSILSGHPRSLIHHPRLVAALHLLRL